MTESRFYICKHCGNLIGMIHNTGVPVQCCGEPMQMLVAGSVDASAEKHLPVVQVEGDLVVVDIGAAAHPMTEEHLIQWVYLQTAQGGQRKRLSPGEAPHVEFRVKDDTPVAVYAYCNLHGLWKTDL